jgi:hypothetical protein
MMLRIIIFSLITTVVGAAFARLPVPTTTVGGTSPHYSSTTPTASLPRTVTSSSSRPVVGSRNTLRWLPPQQHPLTTTLSMVNRNADADPEDNQEKANENNNDNNEAETLRKKAQELRQQIRDMEATLGDQRLLRNNINNNNAAAVAVAAAPQQVESPMSLRNKQVLVVGANGRVGSMVCRYLLRNHPQTKVVACCHYIGEDSMTSRGYGRLSYEVGAEDGVGRIGPAWSSADERTATFEYADYMKDYQLQNLRLVECELLDPVQCTTICEGIDSVIWWNQPRAISGLNVAFLFRALAAPTKGRVEIEGLRNLLGGLKTQQQEKRRYQQQQQGGSTSSSEETKDDIPRALNVVLVSTDPDAFEDFETPLGTFNGLKREGEDILKKEFPSLSYSILQMGRYDDNFVAEDLDVQYVSPGDDDEDSSTSRPAKKGRRKINRRDAARAAVDALTNNDLRGKVVRVWTQTKR